MSKNNAYRTRFDFSKIPATIQIPNLIEVQKRSYERFLQMDRLPSERDDAGLQAVFQSGRRPGVRRHRARWAAGPSAGTVRRSASAPRSGSGSGWWLEFFKNQIVYGGHSSSFRNTQCQHSRRLRTRTAECWALTSAPRVLPFRRT